MRVGTTRVWKDGRDGRLGGGVRERTEVGHELTGSRIEAERRGVRVEHHNARGLGQGQRQLPRTGRTGFLLRSRHLRDGGPAAVRGVSTRGGAGRELLDSAASAIGAPPERQVPWFAGYRDKGGWARVWSVPAGTLRSALRFRELGDTS